MNLLSVDPVTNGHAAQVWQTASEPAIDSVQRHAIPMKRHRSTANDLSLVVRFVMPRLGTEKVSDIGHREIQTIHVLMKTAPYQANKVMALRLKMFALAVKWSSAPTIRSRGLGATRNDAETDCRLHDNRHTYASRLVSSGLSLEIIGRLPGHTKPVTTQRYAHLADDRLRAVAERFGSDANPH